MAQRSPSREDDDPSQLTIIERLQANARRRAADYTLVHRGRQIRVGPLAFWLVVATVGVMTVWTVSTASYFAFREDVLTRLVARQADMQFGYEDRIAELRAQVDRMSSRQLLDQEQYAQKLEQLMRRQAMLESRASALNGLADPATTGTLGRPTRSGDMRVGPAKPSPIGDEAAPLSSLRGRGASLETGPLAGLRMASADDGAVDILAHLQSSLDRVEAKQNAALTSAQQRIEAKTQRIRGALADVGVDANKLPAPGGIGGPFIPVRLPREAGTFERQMQRLQIARAQAERLSRLLTTVPLRRPVEGEIELSSSFGVRVDPFTHSPAMHTGLDFRGDMGEPIRATASGRVTMAGWQGGYGRMVEVDHGNGLATRYGHLSAIDVKVGQVVKLGQVVGRLGSTGRSTGPHLHYETRIDGEAVDPQRFLRAGARIAGDL